MDSDNSELDIDELLRELDPDITPSKKAVPAEPPKVKDEAPVNPTPIIGKGQHHETNSQNAKKPGTGNGKSVRFSQNNATAGDPLDFSSGVISKKPSSLLNTMFFNDASEVSSKNDPTNTTMPQQGRTLTQPESKTKITEAIPAPTKELDWLGLKDDEDDDEDFFRKSADRTREISPNTKSFKNPPGMKKAQPDFLDDIPQEAFSLRWTSDDVNKPEQKIIPLASKPPIPPKIKAQSISPPPLSRSPSNESLNQIQPSKSLKAQKQPEPINFDKDFETSIPKQRPPPTASTASTSILDALPFLRSRSEPPSHSSGQNQNQLLKPPRLEEEQGGRGDDSQEHLKVMRRKVVSKAVASNNNSPQVVHTLQLPSHLVNEDELKAMSSSLKTLYANQLEMQEKSYKEQLDFFSSANKRKEDLLHSELDRLQEDYEARIQKLRDEVSRSDGRIPQNLQNEISNLVGQLGKIELKLETVKDHITSEAKQEKDVNYDQFRAIVGHEIVKHLENSSQNISKILDTDLSNLQSNINDKITTSFEKERSVIAEKLDGVAKLHKEMENLTKGNANLNERISETVVSQIEKVFERERLANQRQKDRMAVQVKELRKDIRRLYFELENKNDVVHKSQLNVEMEQRNINQSIRDMNTFLKVSKSSHEFGEQSVNFTSVQLAAMQAVQTTMQNESEIKLLREERNSLSESIAQLNVERRKLSEEKMHLENSRMELERERNRIRDIENTAKSRIIEAEEMMKQAELIKQQQNKLEIESQTKLEELSKDKSKLKSKLFEIDQTFMMKEQKNYLEKVELAREREFVEKLRDELLCPGCLKSTKKGPSVPFNLAPPPYHQHQHSVGVPGRSSGDGIDFSLTSLSAFGGGGMPSTSFPKFTPEEKLYFANQDKFLDDLAKKVDELSSN